VLYGGSRFRCRSCHNLRYSSQYEPAYQRAIDQADKLRKRVDGHRGAFDGDAFPPKPKGMHWATYWRLEGRYTDLQNRWSAGVIAKFGLG
jgi:pyruvate-formate lyase-activating enzyme